MVAGKTTLSADPERYLIGDDEHGWDDDGIFNFEGGCYAKTINLAEETEPDIYRAIRCDALLENVHLNEDGSPDYFNVSKTQNGRVRFAPASTMGLGWGWFLPSDSVRPFWGLVKARKAYHVSCGSYPIHHIDNWHAAQMAGHPENVIFLTCDAFGVRLLLPMTTK